MAEEQPDETNHTDLQTDEGQSEKSTLDSIMRNLTTAFVVLGALGIAAVMVWQLRVQTTSLNDNPTTYLQDLVVNTAVVDLTKVDDSEKLKILLEHDAQFLRTKRAQSIVSARLFVQSISIIAGISLLLMGSSFVFSRIETANGNQLSVEAKERGSFIFNSYSPGLYLALMGTAIIMATLVASVKSTSKTTDRPVFLDWPAGSFNALDNSHLTEAEKKDEKKKTLGFLKKLELKDDNQGK